MHRLRAGYTAKNRTGSAFALAPALNIWLAAAAAFLMAAGAVYAGGHDHEDHADHDAECVVCSIASSSAAKLAPAEPLLTGPSGGGERAPGHGATTPAPLSAALRNARAPPLFSPPL